MELKLFLNTFALVFLAEIFDKTEIAVVSLSLKNKSKSAIFFGAMTAFFISTLIALFAGSFLNRLLNPRFVRYISSAIFFVTGALIMIGKL